MDFDFPENPDSICQTLYNSETTFSHCIGFCSFHKVYVTSQQMKRKKCLQKECDAFIKNPSHQVWALREIKKKAKIQRKLEKKRKEEFEAAKLHIVPKKSLAKTACSAPTSKKRRYICLDLEISELTNKQRKATKGLACEVIQIGAVMLDEKFNYLGEFSTFVKPIYSIISEEITALTGICNADVENADIFGSAFYKLFTWAGSGKDDITTLCWSDSDYKQLWDEIYIKARKHDEYRNFLKSFVDLQAIFDALLDADKPVSLDSALKFCHLKFEGQRHTAISDAFNTARIFHKLIRQKKGNMEFNPLWKYTETEFSKLFKSFNSLDNDFTTSFASFMSNEIRTQFAATRMETSIKTKSVEQAEKHTLKAQKSPNFFAKRFLCTKYGINFSVWAKFSLRMCFARDMKLM